MKPDLPDRRADPLPYTSWGLYNWGIPRGVYRTLAEARAAAAESSGKPWAECKEWFEVHRVLVQKTNLRPRRVKGKMKGWRHRHNGIGVPANITT